MSQSSCRSTVNLLSIVLITSIGLYSCGPSAEEKWKMENNAQLFSDSISTAATKTISLFNGDTSRTFVRNANLSFKVKNVQEATFAIEKIVLDNKGYVTSTILESTINNKNSQRISADSMLDVIKYTVNNTIAIRVPNNKLDQVLSQMTGLIVYLDYRKIIADDVTKQFQSAKLSESRLTNHKKRMQKEIDTNGKKLNQIIDAEDNLLIKQELQDESKLNTLDLAYDVAYSTVSLNIYQNETTKKESYAYALPIEPYTPNFLTKLVDALNDSATIFGAIILFFVKIWPITFLAIGLYVAAKVILKRK